LVDSRIPGDYLYPCADTGTDAATDSANGTDAGTNVGTNVSTNCVTNDSDGLHEANNNWV